MIIKRILLGLFSLAILVSMVNNLNAQVAIGLLEKPSSGALLQLKNIEAINDGRANANRGLVLPRVTLTSITNLYPMFPVGYEKDAQDIVHTGLMVYNVNENLFNGVGAGLYVWDSEKWIGVGLTARSILANPTSLYLSEISPTANAKLTTVPENIPWSMTASNNTNSSSYRSREHRNDLLFTRDNIITGNKTYTFTIDNSDKHANIEVAHISLSLNKDSFKVGENGTVSSSSIVVAEGGDADWFVKDYTSEEFNWTVAPHNDAGSLSFALGSITQPGTIWGTITVAHVNDANYIQVITVEQNKDYIILPEFDYLVIRYVYAMDALPPGVTVVDLDTATEFTDTGVNTVDLKAVGWNLEWRRSANGKDFLFWPDDNRRSGYESVYANMSTLRDDILPSTAAREFNVDMYATWFVPTVSRMRDNNMISINIILYRGGVMKVHNTYDYINEGGTKVFELEKADMPVTTYRGVKNFRTTGYTKMLRLEYDRIDNTGVLAPFISTRRTVPLVENLLDVLPNETKDEHAERYREYLEQKNSSSEK